MAGPRPDNPYNPTPEVEPSVGMPPDLLTTRANPAEFGAQVGQALEGAGNKVQQVGQEQLSIETQKQQIVNEVAAQNGETLANTQYGDIDGWYRSLKGMDAVANKDEAMRRIQAVRTQILSTMPTQASQRAFNTLIQRSEGFMLRNTGEYAGSQLKEAHVQAIGSSIKNFQDMASNPDLSEQQMQYLVDNAKAQLPSMLQLNNGIVPDKVDSDGTMHFKDPGSQAVADQYSREVLTEMAKNRAEVLAYGPKGNPVIAMNWLDAQKWIPLSAKAQLEKQLTPAFRNEQSRSIADNTVDKWNSLRLGDIDKAAQGQLTGPQQLYLPFKLNESSNGMDPNAKGNLFQITQHTFTQYSQPGHTDYNNEGDRQLAAQKYIDSLWVKNSGDPEKVAAEYFSGTPNPNDNIVHPGQTISPATYVSRFMQHLQTKGNSFIAPADYFRDHAVDIVNEARQQAIDAGYDATTVDSTVAHAQQRINLYIEEQNQRSKANMDLLNGYIQKNHLWSDIQLEQAPDQIRDAYHTELGDNPIGIRSLTANLFTENSRGLSAGYGQNWWNYASQVMSGKITQPKELLPLLENMKNGNLTNNGYYALTDMLKQRETPEGRAFSDAQFQYLQNAQHFFTGNFPTPQGMNRFQTYIMETMPIINGLKGEGKTAKDLFNPKGDSYLHPEQSHWIVPMSQMMKETSDYAMYLTNQNLANQGIKTPEQQKQANRNQSFLETLIGSIPSPKAFIGTPTIGGEIQQSQTADEEARKKEAKRLAHDKAMGIPEVPVPQVTNGQ